MGFKGHNCSKTTYYSRIRRAKALGCSVDNLPDGRGHHTSQPTSQGHYRWNAEGTRIGKGGYVMIRVGVEHPLAFSTGYALAHHVVWASAGRVLPEGDEVLHHRNGDKTDNRLENLELMKRVDHSVMHSGGLPDEAVREIRELYAQGVFNMSSLAKQFGVSGSRISKIIRGETRLGAGGPTSTSNRGREWRETP